MAKTTKRKPLRPRVKKPSRARARAKGRPAKTARPAKPIDRDEGYRKGLKGSPGEQRTAWLKYAREGRPGMYVPQLHNEDARLCAMLGLTDEEIAQLFKVALSKFYEWQKKHPEFREALQEGKTISDARVAGTLYQRAMGWEHPAQKIFKVEEPLTDDEGKPVLDANGHPTMVSKGLYLPYTERFPPDVGAIKLWLTNRQPKRWRERSDLKVDGTVTIGDIVRRSYELEREQKK